MIEPNEATTTEVTVDPNPLVTTVTETNATAAEQATTQVTVDPNLLVNTLTETNATAAKPATTQVTVDPNPLVNTLTETNASAAEPATSDAADPTLTFTIEPVVTTDDPQPTNNFIDELKSINKQIDNLNKQLDLVIAQRDQLLSNSDACSSIKQEINRLLGKLVPYANCFANFIQSLQNNLNNIEISTKVDPEFFVSLTSFTENYEPNDEETSKIINNLGGTIVNRAGYSPLAILSGFNAAIKSSARLNSDVNEYNKNVVAAVKQPLRLVNTF